MNIARNLDIEAEAARVLLANINDIVRDDEDAAHDAVEGETSLFEVIQSAVDRIGELEALSEATKARQDALKARRDRFDRQAENLRTALHSALGVANLKKVELPLATISCRPVPAKAIVSSEADIPAQFWKAQPPKIDLKGITEALKAKADVPGASLSNGGETVSIRFK